MAADKAHVAPPRRFLGGMFELVDDRGLGAAGVGDQRARPAPRCDAAHFVHDVIDRSADDDQVGLGRGGWQIGRNIRDRAQLQGSFERLAARSGADDLLGHAAARTARPIDPPIRPVPTINRQFQTFIVGSSRHDFAAVQTRIVPNGRLA